MQGSERQYFPVCLNEDDKRNLLSNQNHHLEEEIANKIDTSVNSRKTFIRFIFKLSLAYF